MEGFGQEVQTEVIFLEIQTQIPPELPPTFFKSRSQSTFVYLQKPTPLSNIAFGFSEWNPDRRNVSMNAYLYESW